MSASPHVFTRWSFTACPALKACLLLLLCLGLTAETALSQSFSTPVSYAVGVNPNSVVSGDLNGDNKPDLVAANFVDNNVSVLLNNADGTFATAVNYPAYLHSQTVTMGDFNNDAKLDLAVGNFDGGTLGSGSVSILLGNGNGTFQTAVNYDAHSPYEIIQADFNNDGKLDVAVASYSLNSLSVLLGNGNGTLQAAVPYAANSQPAGVATADFTNDGKLDLVTTNYAASNISLLVGNGDGTFQAPTSTFGGSFGLAIADLNSDGKQDLITNRGNDGIVIRLGNGNGTFQLPPLIYSGGDSPCAPKVADFNGDGKLDVVTGNYYAATLSVLRGNGDGTLQPRITFPAKPNATWLDVGDFNVDGKPDVAIASNGTARVNVVLNSPQIRSFSFGAVAGAPATDVLVGRFTDYDPARTTASFTAPVNWGDGTTPTSAVISTNSIGGFDVNASHTYAKEGTYHFPVSPADSDGNFDSTINPATVSDAPLTATGTTITPIRNVFFSAVVAHFTDADPTGTVSEFSATIDWGDGSNSAGTISVNGTGGFDVSGLHAYGEGESFPIVVRISDVGGSTAAAPSTANIDSSCWIQFKSLSYSTSERGSVFIRLFRFGDFSKSASVDYTTTDAGSPVSCAVFNGKASSRCDFTATSGTVHFERNQVEAGFRISITEDSYVEGTETLGIKLSNPIVALLPEPTRASLTIFDGLNEPPTNPIDSADGFVSQHYLDFLNRQPDGAGLVFWSNQITDCQQPGATCDPEAQRVNVSAAFFFSIEFQETGFLVERIYKSGYGDFDGTSVIGGTPHLIKVPIVKFDEFLADTQQIGKDVIVGVGNWPTQLENNKVAFTQDFVARSSFVAAFPTTLTPAQDVDKLFENVGITPTDAERGPLVDDFGGAGNSADIGSRARALRRVAEHPALAQAETNKAFVLMQYFGYLRRDPNAAPDTDHTGYDFWLHKLDQFNGNYIDAEMVRAFISSIEYRQRFAP